MNSITIHYGTKHAHPSLQLTAANAGPSLPSDAAGDKEALRRPCNGCETRGVRRRLSRGAAGAASSEGLEFRVTFRLTT